MLQFPVVQIPPSGEHHYFFYGACTEDQLSIMIAKAESYGCEFLSIVPMQMPVKSSRLALAGKPQTELVTIYRIFVRCFLAEFTTIRAKMEKDSTMEKAEGFRLN